LLIDADLRKPSVSKLLFQENLKPGLSEVLMGTATAAEATVATAMPNLWVIPAGGIASNPSELLAQPQVGQLIEKLREEYDRVVIDSSPVLAVRLLSEAGAQASGLVLNRVRQGGGAYYAYAYRTCGSYGAKGVYGETSAPVDPTI